MESSFSKRCFGFPDRSTSEFSVLDSLKSDLEATDGSVELSFIVADGLLDLSVCADFVPRGFGVPSSFHVLTSFVQGAFDRASISLELFLE